MCAANSRAREMKPLGIEIISESPLDSGFALIFNCALILPSWKKYFLFSIIISILQEPTIKENKILGELNTFEKLWMF